MATIEFRGIRKQFGKVTALETVDLVVADRSFTCLVGPSGSGKSTLLNIVAGFEAPSAGYVAMDGRDITLQPPGARDVAMVFQSYALYPHMSVFDNMAFGLRVRKTPKHIIRERVTEAAELLQIADLLGRKPRQLSGGQRQRVALGRAITRHPKVFLLDEPLSNLDAQLRLQTRVELKLLFDRIGGTVIYVTHDQAEAMTLADSVVVLDQGRVQQVGPPLDVYDHPDTVFVARFLGSPPMNVITARIQMSPEGRPVVETLGFTLPIDPRGGTSLAPDTEVLLGFRPEAVTVGGAGVLPFSGQLQLIEHLGNQDVVYLLAGGHTVVATAPSRSADVTPRQAVSFQIDPTAIHLFDATTSDRIRAQVVTAQQLSSLGATG